MSTCSGLNFRATETNLEAMDLHLSTVLNEIHDARTKWYYIGLELKLDVSTLKAIEFKYSDSKDCLREVIMEWLKAVDPEPTWRNLVDALRRPVVEESKLAAVIEGKYCSCITEGREAEDLTTEIQKLQWQLQDKENENQHLKQQLQEKEQKIREKDHIIKAQERPVNLPTGIQGSAAVEGNIAYFRIPICFLSSQAEAEDLTKEIQKLQRQLQDKEDENKLLKQQLQEKEQQIREKEQQIREKEQQIREKDHIINAQERPVNLPTGIRGSAAVEGNIAYFRIGGHPTVYAYDSSNSKWLCIYPECPCVRFGIAVINGLLTAIGGQQDGKVIGALLSLTGEGRKKQWSEKFSEMPTKRLFPGILHYQKLLIIAGGTTSALDGDSLSTVEVMDTETHHWTTTQSLPHPFIDAWLTVCGDKMYMLGGNVRKTPSKYALTHSVNELYDKSGKWDRITNVPVYNATCATVDGQLLAVGGKQSLEEGTTNSSTIYAYNPTEKTWSIKCHMKTPRSFCLAAALPSNKLMVVGGFIHGPSLHDEATNEFEIISI